MNFINEILFFSMTSKKSHSWRRIKLNTLKKFMRIMSIKLNFNGYMHNKSEKVQA